MKAVSRKIIRVEPGATKEYTEKLPLEEEIRIIVDGKLMTTARITPDHVAEFLTGHLYAKGVIDSADQISEITEGAGCYMVKVHSSSRKKADTQLIEKISFDYSSILAVLRSALDSPLFKETGGTHSSALCQDNVILCSAEDVGRLNTIDKIIGHALLSGLDIRRCYIVTSGRITKNTVDKAVRAGIQLVASKGAVTSLAAMEGERGGITIVGFARESRMSIYTRPDRIEMVKISAQRRRTL